MGHKISWDNPDKTVVLQQYTKGATKEDLYLMGRKSAQMLNSVEYTVHLIIDERHINLTLNFADVAYLERLVPPNQGAVVVIVPNTKRMYKGAVEDLGKQVGPRAFANVSYAESLEEARAFLQKTFGVRYTLQTTL